MENTTQQAPVVRPSLDSIGTLIANAWRLMTANAQLLFTLSLGQTIIGLAILWPYITDPKSAGYSLASFTGSILAFVATLAMVAVLQKDQSGQPLTLQAALLRGLKLLPSFILVTALASLFIVSGVIGLGFLSIIFGIWASFTVYILVAENLRGFAAIAKSSIYAQGYVGDLFIRSAFVGVATIIISFLAGLLISGIAGIQNPIIMNSVAGAIAPFSICFSFLMYKNIVALKTIDVVVPSRRLTLIKILTVVGLLVLVGLVFVIANAPAQTATIPTTLP